MSEAIVDRIIDFKHVDGRDYVRIKNLTILAGQEVKHAGFSIWNTDEVGTAQIQINDATCLYILLKILTNKGYKIS
jgi:hypothetical protein